MRDPSLLKQFLWVHLLERHFNFITYFHIPRSSNYVSDDYANYVLYWHLSHLRTAVFPVGAQVWSRDAFKDGNLF